MRNLDGDGTAMVESPQVPTRTKVGTLHLSAGTNVTLGPCPVLSILSEHSYRAEYMPQRSSSNKAQTIYCLVHYRKRLLYFCYIKMAFSEKDKYYMISLKCGI